VVRREIAVFVLDTSRSTVHYPTQWRRQNVLRGRAKIEIMSWALMDHGLQGRVQQLLDD